jgi:hypothetical protein
MRCSPWATMQTDPKRAGRPSCLHALVVFVASVVFGGRREWLGDECGRGRAVHPCRAARGVIDGNVGISAPKLSCLCACPLGKAWFLPSTTHRGQRAPPKTATACSQCLMLPTRMRFRYLGGAPGVGGGSLYCARTAATASSASLTKLAFTYATRSMGSSFSSTMTRAQSRPSPLRPMPSSCRHAWGVLTVAVCALCVQ